MYTLVTLLGAPKLPDFNRVARFGSGYPQKLPILAFFNKFMAKISQKSGNYFHRVARSGPWYLQKSMIWHFWPIFVKNKSKMWKCCILLHVFHYQQNECWYVHRKWNDYYINHMHFRGLGKILTFLLCWLIT